MNFLHSVNETRSQYDLNLFFESSADMLCIAGFDGYFKKVNPAMCTLLGYSHEELLSRPIGDFILPEDTAITGKFRERLREGTPLNNFENRYVTKNGHIVWLSWTSIPDTQRDLVYAIAKNVTHIRKLSDDRNMHLSKLTKKHSHLKQLTFSASHDLRSPLGNIIGILSIIDYSTIKDADTLELLDMLKISAEKMHLTLDKQIDSIRESEKLSVDIEDVNLHNCLESTTESIKSYITTTRTHIQNDFSAFHLVRFNKAYMESIFLNLITNSIRYSKPDRDPVISIKSKVENGSRSITFSDNGLGMDINKVKGKIFGFSQTFHNYKDSKGIGLYLVRNYVQAMGGTIRVESEIDKGSTFTITFANTNA